eukprot:c16869_g1_i1.p1 GENE.c16869_g1_i1~~c16869_g1_i1.p1  ORF type:complete len:474 (+),score=90.59 c16869_g1_i1:44-1465(+)
MSAITVTLAVVLGLGAVLGVASLIKSFRSTSEIPVVVQSELRKFQAIYLVVFVLMAMGDWLQGPYLYLMYQSYGFSMSQIGSIFVAGYGSSFLLGTVAASLSNRVGSKGLCLTYAVSYMISCASVHFNNTYILVLGRVLGGLSTSLLYSAFDSWMVCEHHARELPPAALPSTFAMQSFLNSVAAILCGLAAQQLTELHPLTNSGVWSIHYGGPTNAFDAAFGCLLLGAILLCTLWTGSSRGNKKMVESIHTPQLDDTDATLRAGQLGLVRAAIRAIFTNPNVLLLGIIQALFDSTMFIFIFVWTPALDERSPADAPFVQHGLAFSCFMACFMCGALIFSHLPVRHSAQTACLIAATTLGTACMTTVVYASHSFAFTFIGFLVFELATGLYLPLIGSLKARHVPEPVRVVVYTLFRLPLNAIVIATLLTRPSTHTTLFGCALMLAACTALSVLFAMRQRGRRDTALLAESSLFS